MPVSARGHDRLVARRRVVLLLGLGPLLLALTMALPAGASAAGGWKVRNSGALPGGVWNLAAIAFANTRDGWTVCNSGILATTNGGVTWKRQETGAFFDVAFANANDGWALGGNSRRDGVFATTNGGATWKVQGSGGVFSELDSITFVNARDGWAVGGDAYGNGIIFATTNGGTTWHAQGSGVLPYMSPGDVAFANASDGWAVGDGHVLATTNGGATWTAQQWPTDVPLDVIAIADASHAWAVGGDADGNGIILATTDGGATWHAQDPGAVFITDAAFANASDGWAVGGDGHMNGIILATTDGGATWYTQYSAKGVVLEGVTCINSRDAWAIGEDNRGGIILTTTSGGAVVPTVTLKLSGLRHGALRHGKSVTAKGTVRPTSLAGSKVTLTVQKERGAKWIKAKAGSGTINSKGAYGWNYKATKKGAYRMQAKVAKTATSAAAKTAWHGFRVK
jgi:photosystem II stability/assembly factor-like uncharacterized protein